ncbi:MULTISPECIES: hypothetical protein [Citricoccus]|uniref:hypothetical protein n=1 Tax=Citricoccus TaxID=169133 RepID=UPI000255F717|nr:hypothetical protein [Citricoccus sp. CH26A]
MADIPVESEIDDGDLKEVSPPAEAEDLQAIGSDPEATQLSGIELLKHQLEVEIAQQVALAEELQVAYQVERELRDEIDVLMGLKPITAGRHDSGSIVRRGMTFLRSGGKAAKVKRRIRKVGRKVPYAAQGFRAVGGILRSANLPEGGRRASGADVQRPE